MPRVCTEGEGVGSGDGVIDGVAVVVLSWSVVETACPAYAQRERERNVVIALSLSRCR